VTRCLPVVAVQNPVRDRRIRGGSALLDCSQTKNVARYRPPRFGWYRDTIGCKIIEGLLVAGVQCLSS
jgi:hypothetical protein